MQATFETITPDQAQAYLKTNIEKNRNVQKKWVDEIVRLMTTGAWMQNGDSIKFQTPNEEGIEHLIDGQHRLLAIMKIGHPVQVLVVRGLNNRAFQTVDAGKKRTAADVLFIAGYTQTTTLAAAARLFYNFRNNWDFSRRYTQVPATEIVDIVEENPGMIDSVNLGHKGRYIVPGSFLVFLHFLTAIEDRDRATNFVIKISEGTNLIKGDPILSFRDKMFRYKAAGIRLKRQHTMGLLIKTWNYYYQGVEIKKVRFGQTETFPIILGVDRKAIVGNDYPEEAYQGQTVRVQKVKQPTLFPDGDQGDKTPQEVAKAIVKKKKRIPRIKRAPIENPLGLTNADMQKDMFEEMNTD